MTTDQNKDLVRRFHEAMDNGDVDAALEFWASDAINHGGGRPGRQPKIGLDGLRRVFESLRVAFPDRQWLVEDMIAEGDTVACRVTVSGTFGDVPEIPVESTPLLANVSPTGKSYSVQQVHIFRIAGGKLVEHRAVRDDLALVQQLGALPQLG